MSDFTNPVSKTIRQELAELDSLRSGSNWESQIDKWKLHESLVPLERRMAWKQSRVTVAIAWVVVFYFLAFSLIPLVVLIVSLIFGKFGGSHYVQEALEMLLSSWGAAALLSALWPLVILYSYMSRMRRQALLSTQSRMVPDIPLLHRENSYTSAFIFTGTFVILSFFTETTEEYSAVILGFLSASLAGRAAMGIVQRALWQQSAVYRLAITGTLYVPTEGRPRAYLDD